MQKTEYFKKEAWLVFDIQKFLVYTSETTYWEVIILYKRWHLANL